MNEKKVEEVALFRYGIIAPLVTGTIDTQTSKTAFFKHAASRRYEDPDGEYVSMSSQTIERWYRLYEKEGFDGLKPKRRSDKLKYRKIDDDIIEQVKFLINEYPKLPATLIYQKLQDNGTITKKTLSLSTVNRLVNRIKKEEGKKVMKEMRRYERKHINEVWCGDSCYGPYLNVGGKKKRTYIIALIDDASRLIVGVDIFFNDDFISLMSVIKSAVKKYGKNKIFNFDNGSSYRCKQMELLAARLGTTINYCPVRTPESKAKIERWFKTLRTCFLSGLNMNDYESIDDLREDLFDYVQSYNQKVHSSLNGKTPQERFFEEAHLIRRVPEEDVDKIFLLEIERKVSSDNVVMIENVPYEVHYRYSGLKLLLRYSPDLSKIYVVDRDTNELEEIHLLDKKSNSTVKRKKIKFTEDN